MITVGLAEKGNSGVLRKFTKYEQHTERTDLSIFYKTKLGVYDELEREWLEWLTGSVTGWFRAFLRRVVMLLGCKGSSSFFLKRGSKVSHPKWIWDLK